MSLNVTARMADAREIAIHVEIAAPRTLGDGSASCRVSVAPLEQQPLEVRGVDSFHAVWLACHLVLKLLAQLRAAGAQLLSPDGSAFPLDAYLAGLDDAAKKSP
ncbi:MAG TPA: hypothetical protein VF211_14970 [Burkholderiales bacterium]